MNIGLMADDSRKKLMQNFCIAYRGILGRHTLYATGSTGRLIEEATSLSVNKFLEGSLGGEEQFSSQVQNNGMDLVFYFRDPQEDSYYNFTRVQKVMRLCDVYSIPLATNIASAELLIKSLDYGDLEWREVYHS